MNNLRNKSDVLDCEFLLMRAKILELAAALDRIDRAPGALDRLEQRDLVRQGIACLLEESNSDDAVSRACQVQLLFSRAYSESWRDDFNL